MKSNKVFLVHKVLIPVTLIGVYTRSGNLFST